MQKQDKTCTATLTVVDEKSKRPIEGALVQTIGTKKGTVTGKDGRAVITVLEGSELKISYIGYESRTIAVNDEKPVAVSLTRNPEAGLYPHRRPARRAAGATAGAGDRQRRHL